MEALTLGPRAAQWWGIGSAMALAALAGWLALCIAAAARRFIELHSDISVEDNLAARRRTTTGFASQRQERLGAA